ncbi:MAG: IS3 family transposase [Geminicoccaceae bacterium]
MCWVIGVTRSCYNAWRPAAPRRSERVVWRDSLGAKIEAIFLQSKKYFGALRIHAELRARVSKCIVARLMQEKGICPPRGRRRVPITTDSRYNHAIASNLLERKFDVAMPDRVWLADISYSAPRPGLSGVHMTGMQRERRKHDCLAFCCEGA